MSDEFAPDYVSELEHLRATDPAAALRRAAELLNYWEDTGRVDEGRAITERLVTEYLTEGARDPEIARAIPGALAAAAELAFRQGDQETATRRAWDTVRAAGLVEDWPTVAGAYTDLARVAYRNGDAPEIEKHARKALEYAREDTAATSGALHMLAWAAYTAGDLDEAERRFGESLEFRRRHRSRLSVAVEIANLGDLAAERGDLPRAAELLAEGLTVSREEGSSYMILNTVPSIAVLAVRAGFDEDAARLFGAGRALASSSGMVPDPNPHIDEASDAARDRLGEARYAQLMSEGTMLTSDAAVDLALAVTDAIRRGAARDEGGYSTAG
jgi:tetratricopeptide (TPR) repeat protein